MFSISPFVGKSYLIWILYYQYYNYMYNKTYTNAASNITNTYTHKLNFQFIIVGRISLQQNTDILYFVFSRLYTMKIEAIICLWKTIRLIASYSLISNVNECFVKYQPLHIRSSSVLLINIIVKNILSIYRYE